MPKYPGEYSKYKDRVSPLATVARPGRFGAVKGAPGVQLSVQHPAAIVTVIARKGHAQELAMGLMELKDCAVRWAGFEQFYVVADARAEGALYDDVKAKLGTLASVSDQSHGRIILRIGGPKSRPVLTKGTPVDLNGDNFPIGKCAVTQMAHVGVHLARTGDETFELSVFRGFAESFWEWLTLQSEEYGYQVT